MESRHPRTMRTSTTGRFFFDFFLFDCRRFVFLSRLTLGWFEVIIIISIITTMHRIKSFLPRYVS